jgi:4-hydroxyacetophenone monooxygenase
VRDPEVARLTGLPFGDDDVIRTATDEASVPALLMSMVHMTTTGAARADWAILF